MLFFLQLKKLSPTFFSSLPYLNAVSRSKEFSFSVVDVGPSASLITVLAVCIYRCAYMGVSENRGP